MVQNTFLIESSFVALLGITIGSVLALSLSRNVITYMAKEMPGIVYTTPWVEVIGIGVLAYAASLLTTYLPARQASKVYPAEALRYE
jgi:ABC-type antimicrobial peptide transport system permease subunit